MPAPAPPDPPALRLLRRAVDVRPGEVRATLLGFAWFLCLLAGYYLLRPLRDALGLAGGAQELRWLFTATFAAMLALVPLFGWLTARLPPRRFVPIAYRFFVLSLLAFCVPLALDVRSPWTGRLFFVWISVFNLFLVSIFWSVLADCFGNAQARRLFGFIAAGGTAGTFAGPALAAALATAFGPAALVLAAALLLEAALRCFHRLYPRAGAPRPEAADPDAAPGPGAATATGDARPLGGGVLAGLGLIARSPYLLDVCGYLLLHTAASTVLYFEQGRLVADAFPGTASRTRFFALVDLGASALTLLLQVGVTGRAMRRFGVGPALAALPVASALAFAALALSPTVAALAAAQAGRRALDYAVARPAREVLFTVVPREAKYKAKNAIETVVYRGGDAASGWIVAGLGALGVGFAGIAALAVPLAGCWALLALRLARAQERRLRAPPADGAQSGIQRGRAGPSRPTRTFRRTRMQRPYPPAPRSAAPGALTRAQWLRGAAGLSTGAVLASLPFAAGAQAGSAGEAAAPSAGAAAGMATRPIPSTGEALPVVGCGTWIGFDHAPGSAEYRRLPGVLDALFAAGGTVIDSSPMYRRAERTAGELLAGSPQRGRAFLATKVWTRGRDAGIAQMEASLALLQAARIDLMQVHNLVDWRTQLATLREWKARGRIRYLGITHYTASAFDEVEAVLRAEPLDFLQINYAADDRAAERRLLPLAADRGVAVLVNQPFGGGGLLRALRGRPLPGWAAEIGCASWAQVLLKFVLGHPAVTCAIPGTGRPEHMADNAAAGAGALPGAAFWRRHAEDLRA